MTINIKANSELRNRIESLDSLFIKSTAKLLPKPRNINWKTADKYTSIRFSFMGLN